MTNPKPRYWIEQMYCPSKAQQFWRIYGNFGGEHLRVVVADYWHPRDAYRELVKIKSN